jgi:AraC family transcriptional regulator of adaptative response/methylated-DNA-[protein]-cysteine methyltransferase
MNANVRTANVAGLPTEQDPRWAAVAARDRAADGTFYYSVKTTGVYCRPSCAGRLPNPKNVRFHRTRADAERAGFRACKRCKPDQAARESQREIPA